MADVEAETAVSGLCLRFAALYVLSRLNAGWMNVAKVMVNVVDIDRLLTTSIADVCDTHIHDIK